MTWLTSVAVLSQQHDLPGATAQRPFALAPENTFRRFHVKILSHSTKDTKPQQRGDAEQ